MAIKFLTFDHLCNFQTHSPYKGVGLLDVWYTWMALTV